MKLKSGIFIKRFIKTKETEIIKEITIFRFSFSVKIIIEAAITIYMITNGIKPK